MSYTSTRQWLGYDDAFLFSFVITRQDLALCDRYCALRTIESDPKVGEFRERGIDTIWLDDTDGRDGRPRHIELAEYGVP